MHYSKMKTELGLRIKSYRNEIKKTQEEFSFLIGIEQANLSKIENGKSFPDITTLCTIIEKTTITPDFLLGFLKKDFDKYSSVDEEIFELIINMPKETKGHLKNLLRSLKPKIK